MPGRMAPQEKILVNGSNGSSSKIQGTSILSLVFSYSWDCKTEVIISNTSFFWSIHDRQIKLSSSGDFVNKWTKQGGFFTS
ncbi:hypothetical protein CapIbe_021749 [Capra ibex]